MIASGANGRGPRGGFAGEPGSNSFDGSRPPRVWEIGRLAPAALLLWFLVDVTLRFLPLDWLDLHPFQVARRSPGLHSPFIPSLEIRSERPVGELAIAGNLPPTEERAPIRFTTDALGFRATPGMEPGKKPRVLVMEGDSFTFGAALSDNETLAASLSLRLRVPVYNAGRFFTDPEGLPELDRLLERLGVDRLTVVYVALERLDRSGDPGREKVGAIQRLGSRLVGKERYLAVRERIDFAGRWWESWSETAPVRILCNRLHRRLCSDFLLPNEYRRRVLVRHGPRGEPFLFLPVEMRRFTYPPNEQTTRRTAEHLEHLQRRLKERGLDLWVVALPDKLSVYGPLLHGDPPLEGPRPHYLDRLEEELRRRRVPVVNGLDVHRPLVRRDLETGRLAYFREDAHWTPLGVERIAGAVAEAMQNAGWRP
jgi:hypothetical protein